MGWDISLTKDGKVLESKKSRVNHGSMLVFDENGAGSRSADMSITYNYSKIYYRDDILGPQGINGFNGKTAKETIPILKRAISNLKDDATDDYWEATEGNVKKALIPLLEFAEEFPDGIWHVI
jgi:hypothetical protein